MILYSTLLSLLTFGNLTKIHKQPSSILSSVHLNNKVANNSLDSANLFSKIYFSSIFIPLLLLIRMYIILMFIHITCHLIVLSLLVKSSKNNVSSRPDGISAHIFLYNCRHSITLSIFLLFRRSLDELYYCSYTVYKICSIIPILKFGDLNYVLNYKPISILPYISKLFESIIYSCVKRILNHIIDDNQHGFHPEKSTITKKMPSLYYFCRFQKAFDMTTVFF